MSEENSDNTPAPGADAGATAQPAEPPITVNGQYIKDLSFEAPTAPGIFGLMQEQEPKINVDIDVNAQPPQEGVFEVVLHVKA
ncbi:MAG: protein-export chaperone SecB, partial [Rhodospirillales bacterium]|nr:protein-export chaperone SecB [Rhodospirillales bacterium]